MNRKNLLMPHVCQKIGWVLLILTPVYLVLMALAFNTFHLIEQRYSYLCMKGVELLLFLSMFFIALSKEREEDEMIRELRLSSVAIIAYIQFSIYILFSLCQTIGAACFSNDYVAFYNTFPWFMYVKSFCGFGISFFGYIFIFKIRLLARRREARKEKDNER